MKKQSMHPEHILKTNYLDPQQKKTSDLADEICISNRKLTRIIKGQASISHNYTDQTYMDATLPCRLDSESGHSQIRSTFVEINLSSFTEKKLIEIDPKLIVLAPFTISEKISHTDYTRKCRSWKKKINKLFKKQTVHQVIDLLTFFILNRRRDLTAKEVGNSKNKFPIYLCASPM